jgi:hypothetical protein
MLQNNTFSARIRRDGAFEDQALGNKRVAGVTAQLFERILSEKPHAEMGHRSCLGIIRLAQQYSVQRMEDIDYRAPRAWTRP